MKYWVISAFNVILMLTYKGNWREYFLKPKQIKTFHKNRFVRFCIIKQYVEIRLNIHFWLSDSYP